MIWKRLFPTEGGGALRRWVRVNKALFEKARDSEHVLKGPISLFDFAHPDDAADAAKVHTGATKGGWRISDDEVIGGFSRGKMVVIDSSENYKRHVRGEELHYDNPTKIRDNAMAATKENEVDSGSMDFMPFIRWTGTLDTTIGENSRAVRSGFCAIRSPQFPFSGANLSNKYNSLEIICRTDGRVYTVNLLVSSYFPDDLYQGFIDIPPTHPEGSYICPETGGHFSRVILPFRGFILTSAGRETEVQRKLDGGVRIESIGITLMDGVDGDFEFDLARVRVVNYYHGEILGEDDEDAPY